MGIITMTNSASFLWQAQIVNALRGYTTAVMLSAVIVVLQPGSFIDLAGYVQAGNWQALLASLLALVLVTLADALMIAPFWLVVDVFARWQSISAASYFIAFGAITSAVMHVGIAYQLPPMMFLPADYPTTPMGMLWYAVSHVGVSSLLQGAVVGAAYWWVTIRHKTKPQEVLA